MFNMTNKLKVWFHNAVIACSLIGHKDVVACAKNELGIFYLRMR